MRKADRHKVFYGWWVVAVSLVVQFITLGLGYYSFGVFFNPLIDHFGWTRATVSAAMSVFLIAWAVACPLSGRLTDRHGPRVPILLGATALGASFCLLSLVNTWWQLYLLYACAGAASAVCSEIPVSAAISNWFSRKRGMAMGIASTGIGLGGLVLAPATGWLILSLGWQATFTAMGLLTWLGILPLTVLVMKDSPRAAGLLPDGDVSRNTDKMPDPPQEHHSGNTHPSGRRLVTSLWSRELWATALAFSLVSFGIIGVTTHETPFLVDMGVPYTTAAAALGVTGGIGILGKLCCGYLADRFSPKWVFLASTFVQAAGVAVLLLSASPVTVWAFVAIFGIAMGGANTLRPLVIGELVGGVNFGTFFGFTEFLRRIGAAAGVVIAGYLFDIAGSYRYAFILIIVAYVAAAALLMPRFRTGADRGQDGAGAARRSDFEGR